MWHKKIIPYYHNVMCFTMTTCYVYYSNNSCTCLSYSTYKTLYIWYKKLILIRRTYNSLNEIVHLDHKKNLLKYPIMSITLVQVYSCYTKHIHNPPNKQKVKRQVLQPFFLWNCYRHNMFKCVITLAGVEMHHLVKLL